MMFLGIFGALAFIVLIFAAIFLAIKKNSSWKKCLFGAIVGAVLFFVGVMNSDYSPEYEATTAREALDFTQSELTQENVDIALSGLEEITAEVDGNTVSVYSESLTFFNEKTLITDFCITACDSMEILFKNPSVNEVLFAGSTEMIDQKGNKFIDEIFKIALTKDEAKDINWENFKDMVSADYNKMLNISKNYYIHPGIAKEL